MTKFYSASAGGFFDDKIHGSAMPEDAVKITDKRHQDLLDGQTNGKEIAIDKNGKPSLADRTITAEDAQRNLIGEATRRLAQTDWRVIRASESGVPLSPSFIEYRQTLRDVAAGRSATMPKEPQ